MMKDMTQADLNAFLLELASVIRRYAGDSAVWVCAIEDTDKTSTVLLPVEQMTSSTLGLFDMARLRLAEQMRQHVTTNIEKGDETKDGTSDATERR